MPGFNRTGPRGMGPMTGGARGLCNPWGRGTGWGMGRGYGMGRGRGFSRSFSPGWGQVYQEPYPYGPTMNSYAPQMGREDELGFLQNQAQSIKEQLEHIDARIRELAGEKGE
ncbi:MAG: DUF5320 domain-containing protein [Chloroflexota bacterium]|nr:DUF5320 domain-containing protein [Chloroflexota bacterium]